MAFFLVFFPLANMFCSSRGYTSQLVGLAAFKKPNLAAWSSSKGPTGIPFSLTLTKPIPSPLLPLPVSLEAHIHLELYPLLPPIYPCWTLSIWLLSKEA